MAQLQNASEPPQNVSDKIKTYKEQKQFESAISKAATQKHHGSQGEDNAQKSQERKKEKGIQDPTGQETKNESLIVPQYRKRCICQRFCTPKFNSKIIYHYSNKQLESYLRKLRQLKCNPSHNTEKKNSMAKLRFIAERIIYDLQEKQTEWILRDQMHENIRRQIEKQDQKYLKQINSEEEKDYLFHKVLNLYFQKLLKLHNEGKEEPHKLRQFSQRQDDEEYGSEVNSEDSQGNIDAINDYLDCVTWLIEIYHNL